MPVLRLLLFLLAVVAAGAWCLAPMIGPATSAAVTPATSAAAPKKLFVAPGGSSNGSCTRARPCATLSAAYARGKKSGTTIVTIAPGDYPRQTIELPQGKRAPGKVVFQPAEPRSVSFGELVIDAPNIEVRRVRTEGWSVLEHASHVTMRGVQSVAAVFITSARDVRVIGGSISSVGTPVVNGSQIKAAEGSSTPPRDILFDGVAIHDWLRAPGSDYHVDCLHVLAVDGLIVRRSRFWNCEAFDLLFTMFGDAGSPRGVLIENNFFQCCNSGYYSVQLGGGHGETWSDFVIRNNTADKGFTIDPDSEVTGPIRIVGNLAESFPAGACRDGVTVDWNVWEDGRRCGRHDRVARGGFQSGGEAEFHLVGCPPAAGRADPDDSPRVDIDGEKRPYGPRPDAGADETRACRK